MATPYEKVYDRFLNRITDFNLAELDNHTLDQMLKGWLHSAIVNTRTSSNLVLRNDDEEIFENDAVLYCPHGRPVITEFTKERIEKMFGRI